MHRYLLRLGLVCALALGSLAVAGARQQDTKKDDDYRRFFRKPETPLEFWKAIQFELDVGRPDLAAKQIRALLATKPTDNDLLSIPDKDGLTPVLRLKGMRVWFDKDEKENEQALKDVAQLVDQIADAYRKRVQDPARIKGFIDQLKKTEEERTFAHRELYRSGSAAVPLLLAELAKAEDAGEHLLLREALEKLDPGDSLAPMLAALDGDNARLKSEVLAILRKKHGRFAEQIVPHLWYPQANPDEKAEVRTAARKLLAHLLNVDESRLTSAKAALAREAERYYQRKVNLGDPKGVVVWRWHDGAVVKGFPEAKLETITPEQANEYWGLRFARQALTLDPTYRPAQLAFLGLAIQSRPSPEVTQLLAKASPELIIELLERALKEKRKPEILATINALGDRAEVRARKAGAEADSALVRALYYPDPQVQMAAVINLIVIPGKPAPKTALRIVEILARQLTPLSSSRAGPKVLVAVGDSDWRMKVSNATEKAGYQAIAVGNGRDAMRKLRAHADVDVILLDSSLPDPGLAFLLAQMRSDIDVGQVPILLAAIPETRSARDLANASQKIQAKLDLISVEAQTYRARQRELLLDEGVAYKNLNSSRGLSKEEYNLAERDLREKFGKRRAELDREFLNASLLSKEAPKISAKQKQLEASYDAESRVRELQLEKFTARYPFVRVVHPSVTTDAKILSAVLPAAVREASVALQQDERNQNAEIAMEILWNMALGKYGGYDVRPVGDTVMAVLRGGGLSKDGQIRAIDVVARLPGAKPQTELLDVIADANGKRGLEVRKAACDGLVQSLQKFGLQLSRLQVKTITDLAKDPKTDAKLVPQLNMVIGALKPSDRSTGEVLRKYDPKPVVPLPPPPEEKDKKDKEKEKDK